MNLSLDASRLLRVSIKRISSLSKLASKRCKSQDLDLLFIILMLRQSKRLFTSEEQKRNIMWNMNEEGIPYDIRKSMSCQTSPQKNQPNSFVHPTAIIETETKLIFDDNSVPSTNEKESFQQMIRPFNEGKIPSPKKIIQIQSFEHQKKLNTTEQYEIAEKENSKKQIFQYEQTLLQKDSQLQALTAQSQAMILQNSRLASLLKQRQNSIGDLGQEIDRLNQIIRKKAQEFQQQYQRLEQLIAMNRNKDSEIEKLTQKISILQQQIEKIQQIPFQQNSKIFESHQIPQMVESEISHQLQRKSQQNGYLNTFMGINRVESIEQDDKIYTQTLMIKIAKLEDRKIELQIEVNRLKDIIDEYLQNNSQIKAKEQRQIEQSPEVLQQGAKQQGSMNIKIPILSVISQKDSIFETECQKIKLPVEQEQRVNGQIIEQSSSQLNKENQDLKIQLNLFEQTKNHVLLLSKELDRVNHIAEQLQQQNRYLNRQVQQNKWRKASMKSLKGNVEELEERLVLQSQQIGRLNNLIQKMHKKSIDSEQNLKPKDPIKIEEQSQDEPPRKVQEVISKQKYEGLMKKVIQLNQLLSIRQTQLFQLQNLLVQQQNLEIAMKNHFSSGFAVFAQLQALRSKFQINEHLNKS